MRKITNFLSWHSGNGLPLNLQRKLRFNCILLCVSIVFSVIMMVVDLVFGKALTFPLFIFSIVVYSVAIVLNRNGRHVLSRILLPLNSTLLVLTLSLVTCNPTVVWFYIVVAIASITLFTYEEKVKSMALIAVCLMAFVISYLWIYEKGNFNFASRYDAIVFLVSYAMCMTAAIVIVFIPIRHEYYAERRLVELTNELYDKQRKYEVVHAASGAILYEYDLVNNRVPPNPQVNRILGYEDHELRAYTFEESAAMIHPDDRPSFIGKIEQALMHGDAISLEYRVRNKTGDYVWFSASSVIERDEKNQPRWMVGSLFNIDDRKLTEQKILEQNEMLRKANEELDNFVYHVSHDVRAPLSSILGLVNLAKVTNDPAELKSYIAMMGERGNALDRFIHDVLAYSKNSRSVITSAPVKPYALIQEIIHSLGYMENMERITMEIDVPTDLEIIGDAHRLRVVFSNLLSNSIKYYNGSSPKSFVKISYNANCSKQYFKVVDNGRGIQREYIPRIFEMFFRATDSASGSGIGLYIVKEIVEKLHGSIEVDSQIGVGTSFVVTLPILAEAR